MLNWTQPNTERPNYHEAQNGFWITCKNVWHVTTDVTTTEFVLMNGEDELGCYDTLAEAQVAAEPEYAEVQP